MASIMCRQITATVFIVLGLLLIAAGLTTLFYAMPTIIRGQVKDTVVLKDGGETTNDWIDGSPYDVSMSFRFFDTLNAADVELNGATPIVVERGPYVYTEYQNKSWVDFSADGNQVRYIANKTYVWNQEASCEGCYMDDLVTVPNLVLLLLTDTLDGKILADLKSPIARNAAKLAIGIALQAAGEKLYVTQKVNDLLYNGYEDKLITILLSYPILKPLLAGVSIPDRIAFFYGANGGNTTADGTYEIGTGKDDVANFGKIYGWSLDPGVKCSAALNDTVPEKWWNSAYPSAHMINGTDGTVYPPFVERTDTPYTFVSQLCRSIYLNYVDDYTIFDIPTYRFTVPASVFAADTANEGFCLNTTAKFFPNQPHPPKEPNCLSAGLLDVSRCQPGPVVISSPHFLYAPAEVVASIGGMNPNLVEHRSEFDLEPTSGVGVKFVKKLQINLKIKNDPNWLQLSRTKNHIHPVFWLTEEAVMTKATSDKLYNQLVIPKRVGLFGSYGVIVLGAVFIFIGLIGCAVTMNEKHKLKAVEPYTPPTTQDRSDSTAHLVTPDVRPPRPSS